MSCAGSGRDDIGSASVWLLVAITGVMSVAAWCVTAAAAAQLRTRAGVAADLAALAGAARVADAAADPCEEAARVAGANGATLRTCMASAVGGTVEVQVDVVGRGVLAHAGPARSRARAGPAP